MERTIPLEDLLSEARWLRALAASLVRDPAAADDLVQDTWLAALRHPPRAGEARPWLARVARNLARNARRGRARREVREERLEPAREVLAPDSLAQAAEAQHLLAEAVTRLPEPLRDAVVLCYFRGLDSRRAGERLGVSGSSVRTRLQEALATLRADLDRRTRGGREAWAGMLVGLARAPQGAPALATASGTLVAPALVVVALGVGLAVGVTLWSGGGAEREAGREHVTRAEPTPPAESPSAGGATHAAAPAGDPRPSVPGAGRTELSGASGARPVGEAEPGAGELLGEGRATAPPTIAGVIRVDGREPDWPLHLVLEPVLRRTGPVPTDRRPPGPPPELERPEATLAPEARGAFSLEVPQGFTGQLQVAGHAFVGRDEPPLVRAGEHDLLIDLRSMPGVTGSVLGPDDRPGAGLEVTCHLRMGRRDAEAASLTADLTTECRSDGRFRLPLPALGEWFELTLRVEAPGIGFLHHETPRLLLSEARELGTLRLEPVRELAFVARDPAGSPLAGVRARVDGTPSSYASAPTEADGRGRFDGVPVRPAELRFAASRYADRVVAVDGEPELEVVLEPLACLELRLVGAGAAGAELLRLSGAGPPPREPSPLAARVERRRGPGAGYEPRRVEPPPGGTGDLLFALRRGELTLIGVASEEVLTLEVLDGEERVLAVATIVVHAGEWAALEMEVR